MRETSADEAKDMEARIAVLEALTRGTRIDNIALDRALPDASAEAWVAPGPEAPAAEMWLQSCGETGYQHW